MEQLDHLIADAELGKEAREFLEGTLGTYLIGLANQELMLAQEELENVNPNDLNAVRDLQNKAKVSRWFVQWLKELVDKGDSALSVWKQQQES